MTTQKTAVIIGATGNVGGGIAAALREKGYTIDPTWTSEAHPDAAEASSYRTLPPRIDVAVYAAGMNLVKPAHEVTDEEWDRVMRVNVTGAFYFARAAFEGLKATRGTFIAISSMNARTPYPNRVAYATSKAAIEGLTRELAVEWGEYGISTHCIRLGPMNKLMKTTKVNPIMLEATKKRLPQHELIPAEAVGAYVAALALGISPWVTGAVIDFDAGFPLNAYPLL